MAARHGRLTENDLRPADVRRHLRRHGERAGIGVGAGIGAHTEQAVVERHDRILEHDQQYVNSYQQT